MSLRAWSGTAMRRRARRGGGTMRQHLRRFSDLVRRRLLDGEHLTLYGPRGGGKSSVLRALEEQLRRDAVPCAYAPVTDALAHITRALECAYPTVATSEVGRRAARGRL